MNRDDIVDELKNMISKGIDRAEHEAIDALLNPSPTRDDIVGAIQAFGMEQKRMWEAFLPKLLDAMEEASKRGRRTRKPGDMGVIKSIASRE